MKNIVGVQFKNNGKVYYFDLNGVNIEESKTVIVETEKGYEYAFVVSENKAVKDLKEGMDLSRVIRVANEEDESIHQKNIKDSEKALKKAIEIAEKLNLTMNFIDAYFNFERTQLMFYFVSDNRVDFRELAKQLASIYKTRIELRQVGVRDKAKEVSGIGPCGRELCCSCFLKDLDSVSISMAKNQSLVLNPTKINGLCGRLLCCLNYEDDLYSENRKDMPELGSRVKTDHGEGQVIFTDIPNKKYIVNIQDYGKETITLKSKCDECGKCNK